MRCCLQGHAGVSANREGSREHGRCKYAAPSGATTKACMQLAHSMCALRQGEGLTAVVGDADIEALHVAGTVALLHTTSDCTWLTVPHLRAQIPDHPDVAVHGAGDRQVGIAGNYSWWRGQQRGATAGHERGGCAGWRHGADNCGCAAHRAGTCRLAAQSCSRGVFCSCCRQGPHS